LKIRKEKKCLVKLLGGTQYLKLVSHNGTKKLDRSQVRGYCSIDQSLSHKN